MFINPDEHPNTFIVPEGDYNAVILEAGDYVGKTGNKTFHVSYQTPKGIIHEYMPIYSDNTDVVNRNLQKVSNLARACDCHNGFDTEKVPFVGMNVGITVKIQKATVAGQTDSNTVGFNYRKIPQAEMPQIQPTNNQPINAMPQGQFGQPAQNYGYQQPQPTYQAQNGYSQPQSGYSQPSQPPKSPFPWGN